MSSVRVKHQDSFPSQLLGILVSHFPVIKSQSLVTIKSGRLIFSVISGVIFHLPAKFSFLSVCVLLLSDSMAVQSECRIQLGDHSDRPGFKARLSILHTKATLALCLLLLGAALILPPGGQAFAENAVICCPGFSCQLSGVFEFIALPTQPPLGIVIPKRELPISRSFHFLKGSPPQWWVGEGMGKTQPSCSDLRQLSVPELFVSLVRTMLHLNCSPISLSAQSCLFPVSFYKCWPLECSFINFPLVNLHFRACVLRKQICTSMHAVPQ